MTEYPDFDRLIRACRAEIELKDAAYGSMWKKQTKKPWWIQRLKNEIAEAEASMSVEEECRKYVNIVNLAAMAREMRGPPAA